MTVKYTNHYNRFKNSFSWNNHEESILNRIEQNKVIKKFRESLAEKRIKNRGKN